MLILLAGWALRLHALGAKSLWYDELRQIEVAERPFSHMGDLLIAHAARPLDYVITHVWLAGIAPVDAAPGRAEFWLRYPAAVWGLLAVAAFLPLARRWLRPLAGRLTQPAALAATALLAVALLAVQYSQELRPYALYLLITILDFYAFDRAWKSGRPRADFRARAWLLVAICAVLGALTHFFFTMLIAAQAVFVALAFLMEGVRAHHWRWPDLLGFGLGALAGLAALFVAARPEHLVLFAEQFLGALAGAPAAGGLVGADTGAVLPLGNALTADFFLVGVLPFFGGGGGWALLPYLALAALGLAAQAKVHRAHAGFGALWLLLAPALVIIYLQYRQQFFALRYILFALPIYLLLIVSGLVVVAAWVARQLHARAGLLTLGIVTAALGLLQLRAVLADYAVPKDDWRRVGAFLTANVRPGDTLGAPDVQAFIRFYAPHQAATVVDANDRGPHEEALANGERFWFVWSDYTLLPIPDTRAWISSLPSVTLQLDPRIKVIYVHPGRTQAEMLAEAESFIVPPPSLP